jgi:hypothetical protein
MLHEFRAPDLPRGLRHATVLWYSMIALGQSLLRSKARCVYVWSGRASRSFYCTTVDSHIRHTPREPAQGMPYLSKFKTANNVGTWESQKKLCLIGGYAGYALYDSSRL